MLAALVARGGATRAQLGESLRVRAQDLNQAIDQLIQRGAVLPAAAGYGGQPLDEILLVGSRGESLVSNELRRALSRRPDRWIAYLAVAAEESETLHALARKRFGETRAALLPETVRSDMSDPELALVLDAASVLDLFNRASDAWHELRAQAKLEPTPVNIVAFSAPRPRSEVLEAFAHGIVSSCPSSEKEVTRALQDAAPSDDKFELCTRALREAAWALRRCVGQKKRPPALTDGEAAFSELQPVAGLALDGDREKARRSLLLALERATDTFGPILAGRISSGGIADHVRPTRFDLIDIARRSGETIGFASIGSKSEVAPASSLRYVASASAPPGRD
ncbi:MAG: hypothetical protein ABSG43_26620 [Solirubrobacteraceae bacterium]